MTAVNYYANDDHMAVVNIIVNENRLPVKDDCYQCYHPKLYHCCVALLFKLMPFCATFLCRIRLAQSLSCIAGLSTLWIVWLFLRKQRLRRQTKLISFAMIALNPMLLGINAQATNDSFVILFATCALYCAYSFFNTERVKFFYMMAGSTAIAALSKGNGLALFPAIILVFVLKITVGRLSLLPWRKNTVYLAVFIIIFLTAVPYPGQYWYSYKKYGSPLISNKQIDPAPHLFKDVYHGKTMIPSLVSLYGTFRILDLIKNPTDTRVKEYHRHQTSLWSQLYGYTHFIYFYMSPGYWRTRNPVLINAGRIIFVLALLPTALLLFGIFISLRRWLRALLGKGSSFIVQTNGWIFDVFLFGYLGFIIQYTFLYHHFSCMKAVFIFPALLAATALFSQGLESFLSCKLCNKKMLIAVQVTFGVLFSLYSLTIASLILKLIVKPHL